MRRTPEPQPMDDAEQAAIYAGADLAAQLKTNGPGYPSVRDADHGRVVVSGYFKGRL